MSMTTSGLATPPRTAPPRVRRLEAKPPVRPRAPQRRHASFGRVLGWAFSLSVLLHFLLLFLSPFGFRIDLPLGGSVGQEASRQPFGMEMVIAIPSENAPDTPPVEEPPVVERPPQTTPSFRPPPVATPGGGAPGGAPVGDTQAPARGSARDALQPGYRDPRLIAPQRPAVQPDTRTEHERYMEHLQARIDAVNDSMGVAAARERRTSDWTITDGSGNRWGLSPEGLHLGGLTVPRELLPLPGATGDNASLEAERERQRQRDEIQRQGEASDRRGTQDERIDAIRREQDSRRP